MTSPLVRVTALFLDIGDVVLTNGWDRTMRRRAAERFGLDRAERDERHSLFFHAFEEGATSLDEYVARVAFSTARPFTPDEVTAFMFAQSRAYPEMLELAHALKARDHLELVAVTNEGRELNEYRIRTFRLAEMIDSFVSSRFIHSRKPDPQIFRAALDISQVPPAQVADLDDRKPFVEVACDLGMHGIHHTGYASTRAGPAARGLSADVGNDGARQRWRSGTIISDWSAWALWAATSCSTWHHGYPVAGYDKDLARVRALLEEAGPRAIGGATSPGALAALLRPPRAVMMLVPAWPAVDAVIRDLLPHLSRGDVVVDGGNSFFRDTGLRAAALAGRGVAFLGVGVSGGEHGARHGPSLMPVGPRHAYQRVRPLFEAIAAQAGREPCVAYLGPGSSGHYVKMVHHGIEYGLMQLIAETYDLMTRELGLSDDELHAAYGAWNRTEAASYLLEITADIFLRVDERTGRRLVDVILDAAKQKGTGMWTSQNAMELAQPVPTIGAAVEMRALSALDGERAAASRMLRSAAPGISLAGDALLPQLRNALYAAMIITYAQGMALLRSASLAYGYGLDLEAVARIWRAGCIIRAALFERVRAAYRARPDLPYLLGRSRPLGGPHGPRRSPAVFSASLAYLDGYRCAWLPANLTQAQRDSFGAHTYERVDARGVFHTEWSRD